jgi:hypothetical protein
MAMMIPDYALVAEVMLFAEGFEDSKTLSRKMVKLYKLASEQLSQQVGDTRFSTALGVFLFVGCFTGGHLFHHV